jgi:cell division protein FtsQ
MARLRRVPWRVPAGILLAAAGLTLGWLWFRDSRFAAADEIFVTGTSSSEEAQVREALREAAQGMSTLHVREDVLRNAVAPYSSVADLEVHADFPHKLSIEVLERRPVATVESGGRTVPATGAGRLLDGVRAPGLPVVAADAGATSAGDHVRDRHALAALRVAAAAPEDLLARSERVYFGPQGMTLDLRNGPELFFGSAEGARTKWRAAAGCSGEVLGRRCHLPRPPGSYPGRSGWRRADRAGPDARSEHPSLRTLNLRVRIGQFSTHG